MMPVSRGFPKNLQTADGRPQTAAIPALLRRSEPTPIQIVGLLSAVNSHEQTFFGCVVMYLCQRKSYGDAGVPRCGSGTERYVAGNPSGGGGDGGLEERRAFRSR